MKAALLRTLVIVSSVVMISACSVTTSSNTSDELIIFTAASFAPVLQEMKQSYEAENKAVTITMNKAGTQELKAQIEQGAEADILISARAKDVDELKEKGLIADSEKFASNDLVIIISREGSDKVKEIKDLANEGIRLVIAEQNAPVGEFSRKLFVNLNQSGQYGDHFDEKVLSNVVSNESNEQNVLSKVLLGEADAGIVYRSSLSSIKEKDSVTYLEVEPELNVRSDYYLVKLKDASSKADDYMDWMKSDKGKKLITNFGFITE